jgi:TRAP-type C4-dicarboxylate transport system permease small subunit
MLQSTVLEVAIGLVFCFASVALIVSSINEAIASALKLRSKSLLSGVKSLLNDEKFTGLALKLYNHALINPIDAGKAATEKDLKHKPSYIESKRFAVALIEVLQSAGGGFAQLANDIDKVQDPQLRQLLQGMYARAGGKIENLRADLAGWFDSGMERVSGAYKRRTQLICLILGLLIAAFLNIDSFHLFKNLWQHPTLTAQISLADTTNAGEALERLKALPIGWKEVPAFDVGLLLLFAGWLVTASSALFGAPFWFDLLQRMVQLRGTGKKPDEDGKK